jgi:hypothetical protein
MTAFGDIQAMASLLGAGDPDDTEAPYAGTRQTNTSFAPSTLNVGKDDGVPVPRVRSPNADPKAIWTAEELVDDFGDGDEDEDDGEDGALLTPEYSFAYKQAINTADAFLGMAHNKDPGTHSCEDLVLTISLPGTSSMSELELDVTADKVKLRSTTHNLSMYLPHRIDADNGKAEWDGKRETLKITAKIKDEENW